MQPDDVCEMVRCCSAVGGCSYNAETISTEKVPSQKLKQDHDSLPTHALKHLALCLAIFFDLTQAGYAPQVTHNVLGLSKIDLL